MKSYGISGELLNLLFSILSKRQISVVHEGHSSAIRRINAGVPHGSVLGPSLFVLFINDLPDSVSSQLAMYAEDSAVYTAYPGLYCIPWSLVCSMLCTSQRMSLTGVTTGLSPSIKIRLTCCLCQGPDTHIFLLRTIRAY